LPIRVNVFGIQNVMFAYYALVATMTRVRRPFELSKLIKDQPLAAVTLTYLSI